MTEPAAPAAEPMIGRADLTLAALAAAVFALVPGVLALVDAAAPFAVAGGVVGVVLMVVSLHLVAGVARLPGLGQAGFAALGAVVTVHAAAGLGLPAPLAPLAGGAVLWLAGALAAPALCRLPPPLFAGATLALGGLLATLTAGAAQHGPPAGALAYAVAVVLTLAALLAARRLTAGEVGAALLAAGDDPRAAAATGIDAPPLRRRLFALGAALAGFGGGMMAQAAGDTAATSLDVGASLLLFGAIVLGNPGSLTGALLVGVPYYLLADLAFRLGAADLRLPLAGFAALLGLALRQRVPLVLRLLHLPGFGRDAGTGKPLA